MDIFLKNGDKPQRIMSSSVLLIAHFPLKDSYHNEFLFAIKLIITKLEIKITKWKLQFTNHTLNEIQRTNYKNISAHIKSIQISNPLTKIAMNI